jgi:hypothetical protein
VCRMPCIAGQRGTIALLDPSFFGLICFNQ